MMHPSDRYHFIGIGGIGMSALALVMRARGHTVSGSDKVQESLTLRQLKKKGCRVFHGHDASHLGNTNVVVFSSAIGPANPELIAAQERRLRILHRSQLLSLIAAEYETIAVTGVHGKTTTSSLLAHVLLRCGADPNFIGGGILSSLKSNAHVGRSNLLVIEADESDKSLLNLASNSTILTNIDYDHVDHYSSIEEMQNTLVTFLNSSDTAGPTNRCYLCADDEPSMSIVSELVMPTTTYGFNQRADVQAHMIKDEITSVLFRVTKNRQELGSVHLPLAGQHNVQNALGVIALCLDRGLSFRAIAKALATFGGIKRRFEYKGRFRGAELIDDYAHHPVEIIAALRVARKRAAAMRLIVVFEPHRFTRTHVLWDDFVRVLANPLIDHLILTDIYAASESPIEGVNSSSLACAIKKTASTVTVTYASNYEQVKAQLGKQVKPGDLVLMLGAGTLDRLAEELTSIPYDQSK